MKDFILECHRRRVFRVAALYVVGAWVALQVADLAFEAWGIPGTMLRHVWIAAIVGFPAALAFGWRFDFVAGRIVRTPATGASTHLSLQRADYLILAALAAVVVAMAYGIGAEISDLRAPPAEPTAASAIDPRSIAILPFVTPGPEDDRAAFLAAGIQDDLLTRLSKISSLKVISRTSTERYRDSSATTPSIGAELGVGKILEGSVQTAGDEVRISAQLIDSEHDRHLWAETYDRGLSAGNLFDIRTEIAQLIARRLQAQLTLQDAEQPDAMPTSNLAAYTAYLKARQLSDVESIESLHSAIEQYQAALQLDPEFPLAYVGLADAYLTLAVNFHGGLTDKESNALAEPPLVKALTLDPGLGQAYATLGLLRLQQGDYASAEQAFEKSLALLPNYSRAYRLYGRLRRYQGRTDEAMRLIQKAFSLDPYSAPVNFDLARAYDESGRFDEALERYLRVVEIEPKHAFAYVYIAAIHYLVYGAVDESLVWYHRAAQNDVMSPSLAASEAFAYMEFGDLDMAQRFVDKAVELGPKTFWAVWTSLLLNLHLDDDEAALRDARTLLEIMPRSPGALGVLRNADLEASRYDAARSRYARAYRELLEPEVPAVDAYNYRAAVDLALVLMRLGEQRRADDLLDLSLEVLKAVPRHGTEGYWVMDVQIYALQGRTQKALQALRQAIDEGWRFNSWYLLEYNPNVESIRAEPEYRRLYASIEEDLARQAERVRALRASGEL